MSNIAVIGLGQGGATAAIKLAGYGHTVDIYEKASQGLVSHDWWDDIRFDVFKLCDLPLPKHEYYTQKSKWLFVSPDEKNSLKVPPAKPMEEISISRRGLAEHLARLAVDSGATIKYDTAVSALVVEDEKVCGVVVDGQPVRYDLVIDASGLDSPFRGQVPDKFGVQATPGKNDIMVGWRAFYRRNPDSPTPNPESTLYIKHKNSVGISWCNLNHEDQVDVLIGRIGGNSQEEKDIAFDGLKSNHEILGDVAVKEGKWAHIGVRCPLGVMVADGYAAVGDSAFMTMPIMGSGIESAMKAGVWLAQTIGADGGFGAKDLWGYQRKFYQQLGCDYVFIDVVKRWALNIDPDMINWLFGCGVVTDDDMALLSTDSENPPKLSVGTILKKACIILRRPSLVGQAIKWVLKALRAKKIASKLPAEYDCTKVGKWLKKYNGIIREIEGEN